jgi:superfamily I DNA/RNA helicase
MSKANAKSSIADRADCMRIFAAEGDTLAAACAYAEHLFKSQGPIEFLSGHKAKGLEWDTVFHLDPWRIPSKFCETKEELEQELNVRYVIETRPKKSLILVETERFTQ